MPNSWRVSAGCQMRPHQCLGLAGVFAFKPVSGDVAADAQHFVLLPARAGFLVFFTTLPAASVHSDHQQLRSVGRTFDIAPFALRLRLPVTRSDHRTPARLAPTLDLLAVPLHLPVDVQRLGRLVERSFGGLPANSLGGAWSQIRFRRQRPVTVLRGKKSRHKCGTGSVVFQ